MFRGKFIDFTEDQLNSFEEYDFEGDYNDLHRSASFRNLLLNNGYRILNVYPCYYQGWECDEWGAVGTKDSKTYILETSHGSLGAMELKNGVKFKTIEVLDVPEGIDEQ